MANKKIEGGFNDKLTRMNACYCEMLRANANLLGVISNMNRIKDIICDDSDRVEISVIADYLENTRLKVVEISEKLNADIAETQRLYRSKDHE